MKESLNRRDFLKLSGSALAITSFNGLSVKGADQSAGGKKRSIKKAIMFGTVRLRDSNGRERPLTEKFKIIKEAGFEGVEPNGGMDQDEVLRARDEAGLKIPSVCCHTHWAKPLSDPNPAARAVGLEGLQTSLRDAKRYGASSVLLVPAVVTKTVSYADAYQRSQAEIRKALPLAEELGVKIAIENVWNRFLLSPLEAARYVDEFNSPWVAWHFDIGNIIKDCWPEQWIRILGKRIQQLHIKEYSLTKASKEGPGAGFNVPFLEGTNDWPDVMKALDEIGYNGWGIAEQGGGDSPEGLQRLSERMDKIFAS